MEIRFTAEEQEQLETIAGQNGQTTEQLVQSAIRDLLHFPPGKTIQNAKQQATTKPSAEKSIMELLAPLRGLDIQFERDHSPDRLIDL